MNSSANASLQLDEVHQLTLDGESVRTMRRRLHELANVFTGVMIGAGLLSEYLEGGSLQTYVADICEDSERGSVLVRELRSQLLVACGEVALPPGSSYEDLTRGSGNSVERDRYEAGREF